MIGLQQNLDNSNPLPEANILNSLGTDAPGHKHFWKKKECPGKKVHTRSQKLIFQNGTR